jgi:hypothetical protein
VKREGRGSVQVKRAKTTLALAGAIACCFAFAAPALAAPAVRPRQATATTSAVLATLTIRTPNVDIKGKKQSSFAKGASGQVLHQGDTLKTDATNGLAEISYTDGSYTRLGPNTEFSITKLSEKQGVRQTQGTLTVGSTWNRAAKVAETGSFEVTAGGATAAVEGTLFSVVCTVPNACQFIDLFDPVLVSMGGAQVQLESAKSVQLDQGQLGGVANLTREDLLANLWVAGNIFLDNVLDFGQPTDLPPATEAPPDNTPPPATASGPVVSSDAIVAPASYPPSGGIVVDQPNVEVGGVATFRGSGCAPGETLSVLFDGTQVGTVPSDGQGNFAGSVTIPQGTSPGEHLLTVRGSACELNVVVNVLGAAATRSLAFTGSSSHTLTSVLVGAVAVMVGAVLVLGSRRRRSSGTSPPPPLL